MRGTGDARLGPVERIFLGVEDGVTHMHIASCAVFEGAAPTRAAVTALLDDRLASWPGYRRRLRAAGHRRGSRGGGPARADWIEDPSFDPRNHIRSCSLAAPGGDAELCSLMGALMSVELDRRRPLWEMWVVDGIEGGLRWALISKIHHSLVDGIAGAELLSRVLDVERHPAAGGSPLLGPSPQCGRERPHRDVHHLGIAAREALAGGWAIGSELRLRAPASSIDGAIGPRRRWAVARATLEDLTVIRDVFGGTVNDVVLAVVTGAFRDLLIARGDALDDVSLHSLIPVSVRTRGDHTADNQLAAMVAALPVDIADPAERLIAVRYELNNVKRSHQTQATLALTAVARRTPRALLSLAARSATSTLRQHPQRSVSTITTNVPGPPFPLYALGCEMVELLPYVPITQGLRIGAGVVSYNGQLRFGVTADHDSIREVAWFCRRLEAGIAELREVAGRAGGRVQPAC